ncbi:holo-ACP synthase [Natronospirillum operosum]|uniref:Holo-[acyl-carrier-protein] synthase n=1 Tax=Natronospirillum operosum TaxID=2759953 RepID=A0A4Z0WBZ7_9GAMM|nr:holo-ACP synthase [Natronospirillum operosum]TGG91100.1 holo-ACP synthase [Natronospirillum operosum]
MIVGVGTDIIRIARMEEAWTRHGERLAERILTPTERENLRDHATPLRYLAKRWAAKEAVAKALGTGIRGGVGFQSIEVRNDDLGRPEVTLFDGALAQLEACGGRQCWLTLSDEAEYAVAFVVISA